MKIIQISQSKDNFCNRLFSEWLVEYRKIILQRSIVNKTKYNRLNCINYLEQGLGHIKMCDLRPCHFVELYEQVKVVHEYLAQRLLMEAKSCMYAALAKGWIDNNSAKDLKYDHIKPARSRLSLEQWLEMYNYAKLNAPQWFIHVMLLALVTGQRRSDLCTMRFDQIHDNMLFIDQIKTHAKICIPLGLKLNIFNLKLSDIIFDCKFYYGSNKALDSEYLIHKPNGTAVSAASLSYRFQLVRDASIGLITNPPTFHEMRSLSERLYFEQGNVNIRLLLGHMSWTQTLEYQNDRGLLKDNYNLVDINYNHPRLTHTIKDIN